MRILTLLFGTAGNALIAFLTHLLLTRQLPVSEYGDVVALTAAVTMLIPVAGITTGWFWLELYGREGTTAVRWGPSARKVCFLAFTMSFAVLAAYVVLLQDADPVATAMIVACVCLMLVGQTLADTRSVRLQLEERYANLGMWQASPQALRSLAVLVLASGLVTMSGQSVLFAYAAASLVTALVSVGALRALTCGGLRLPEPHVGQPPVAQVSPESALPGVRACFSAAFPFALVTLFYLMYSTGILVLLNPLIGAQGSAYYNVGFLIFNSLAILPSVIYGKFLASKLFRWWSHDQVKFVAAFHLGVASHLGMGLALGACTWFAAPVLVPMLFGEQYHAAVPVVQILALAVPIRFVQHGYGSVLFSKEHIRRKVRYMGQAAILSVLLLLWLAPAYGVEGAAACSVASELALLVFYTVGAARHVEPINVRATWSMRTLCDAYRHFRAPGMAA